MSDQKMLWNGRKKTTDVYTYSINCGGELGIKSTQKEVEITFVDGKLSGTSWSPMGNENTVRSNWYIQGGIAKKILEIEESYKPKVDPLKKGMPLCPKECDNPSGVIFLSETHYCCGGCRHEWEIPK